MAGSSLLALLDDIASVLDDVALLTKVAARKTAGVLGDDLALNAQQVSGVRAERELPVVWAVAKGSAVNKAILVPSALAISALMPWAVIPLLMLGGLFLCFEGVEKLAHKLSHRGSEDETERAERVERLAALVSSEADVLAVEKRKIKGAIRTDFILSAEIVTIALGEVAATPFGTRVAVLVGISALMTVGVYGLVAGIVKLDDLGQYLFRRGQNGQSFTRAIGAGILAGAPFLMKGLSIAGTVAMFLVGGGILTHGIPGVHGWIHHLTERAGNLVELLLPMVMDAVLGIIAGGVVLLVVNGVGRLRRALGGAR